MAPKKDPAMRRKSVVSRKSFIDKNGGGRGSTLPPLRQTSESPTKRSVTDSPTKRSMTESPTKRSVNDSPTKRSVTDSPTKRLLSASSSSRQPTQDKIALSQKAPLPPIAPQPVVLEDAAIERLLQDAFATGADKPTEDELISQYQLHVSSNDIGRQAVVLHQLGLLLLEKANARTPAVPQDFLRASIVLNCSYARCSYDKQRRMLIQKIQHVQRDFLSNCAGVQSRTFHRFYVEEEDEEIDMSAPIYDPGNRYRGLLTDVRREASMFVSKFYSSWDRFQVACDDDKEENRSSILGKLEKSAGRLRTEMQNVLKVIVKDCEDKLGQPPCQYTVVAVGDLATNQMTPYTPLEYVILVSDDSHKNLKYFHNLCDLVTLSINSIGETPLTHARLVLHEDFYNKHIMQFADTVTPCGVKNDQHSHPSTMTPYCLRTYKEMESISGFGLDLIKQPKDMAKMVALLQRKGLNSFAMKLYQCGYVYGNQELYKAYEAAIENHFSSVSLFDEDKPRELAQKIAISLRNSISQDPSDDIQAYDSRIQLDDLMREIEAVKQFEYMLRLIFRCPLKSLGLFLEELKANGAVTNPDCARNFRMLLGLAYVLKVSHSLHHESHIRKINMIKSNQQTSDLGEAMFGWNVDSVLEHFYKAYSPLWQRLELFCRNIQDLDLTASSLCDNSVQVASKAYYRLNKTQQSIEHIKGYVAGLKKNPPEDAYQLWKSYTDLGHVALLAKNFQLAKGFFTRAMETKDKISDPDNAFIAFTNTWFNLGLACFSNNDFVKAQTYMEESLTMVQENNPAFLQTEPGKSFLHKVHLGLARCKHSSAMFKQALVHYNQALQFFEGSDSRHKLFVLRNLLLEIAHLQLLVTQHKECHVTLRRLYALNNCIDGEYTSTMSMATTLRLLSQLMEGMGKMKQTSQYGSAAYNMASHVLDARSMWLQEPPTKLHHPDNASLVHAIREYAQCAGEGKALPAATRAMELIMGSVYRPGQTATSSLQHVRDNKVLGKLYLRHEQPLKAYNNFQKCLELLLKIFGKKHNLHMVFTHCQIGCSLNALGRYENALDSFSVAVLQADVCLPDKQPHEVLADIYEQMAEANHHLQRYEKATVLFEDCIKIRKKLYGDVHPVIAQSLKNQGLIFYKINEGEKAVQYLEQSVQMAQMLSGHKAKSVEIAKLLTIIAIVYEKMKKYDKAEESFKRSLAMHDAILKGTVSEEKVEVLERLGNLYRTTNDVYKAIATHKQCLELMRRLLGTENLKVARLLALIASHYQSNQLYNDTITIYENAIEIYRRVYGSDHSQEVGDWLINLAKCYEVIGDKEKASECHNRALEINQSSSGQDVAAREVYLSLKRLAETAETKGLTDQALMLHKQALEQCYQIYGRDKPHPDTISALECVAKDYLQMRMHDEALDSNTALLSMLMKFYVKDKDQPQTAEALNRAGVICEAVGRTMDAIKHYRDALKMYKAIHKGDHVKTARCHEKLGHALDKSGEGQEAVDHLETSLEMQKNLKLNKGPKMEFYCQTLYHLGLALETHPNFEKALEVHEQAFNAWKDFLTMDDEKKTTRIPQSVHIANCYHAIARTQIALEDYHEGIKNLLNHIEVRDKLPGRKKLSMVFAHYFTELGVAYKSSGNMEQAIVEFSNAVRIIRQLQGHDKPNLHVAKCLGYLATCYGDLTLNTKAMETAKEAVDMYERVLAVDSPEHAIYVELVSFLGDLYLTAGKPKTALKHYQKTFQYYMNIHGDNSFAVDVNTAMRKVMEAKAGIEQAKEAKRLAEEERQNKRKARLEAKQAAVAEAAGDQAVSAR